MGKMKYMHYKISVEPSDSIVIKMNKETNFTGSRILLLDEGNYYKYKLGRACESKQEMNGAPLVTLAPPYKSLWHIIIELHTAGEVRAYVEVRRRGP